MKVADLDTPVLLLDLDALERNIGRMRDMAAAAGVHLRPHAKTHKSPAIARMQIAAGAVGICCAKLGEAEVMAAAGIDNILITTPVIGESKIGRLMHVRNQARVAVVSDSAENIEMLGRIARLSGRRLDVLVEVDVGQGRCGVPDGAAALALARLIADDPWLDFAGLQGYQGKIQMIPDSGERRRETGAGLDRLAAAVAEVEAGGIAVPVRTGGGTGSSPFDLERGLLTEIQAGSYVFMDSRYAQIVWPDAGVQPFEQAIHLLTSVISHPVPGRAVVDAGLKSASSDHGPPAVADAEGAGLTFEFGGDEHGIVRRADGGTVELGIGRKIRLVPSHCDTTVNLFDQYMVVQEENVVDVWPIEGRGRVQ
ncbi:MAG: DSD1 family PLP-dependent enzyme [Rhodospirillaceae bacterium]